MAQAFINGEAIPLDEFAPEQSLLDFLRNTLGLTGTKEGCASGDCGACTVLVAAGGWRRPRPEPTVFRDQQLYRPARQRNRPRRHYRRRPGTPAQPHPVQRAMVETHGSQCGFCTPGFIMAMAAAQLDQSPFPEDQGTVPSHDTNARAISGNLCRCTGYRPILSAMEQASAALTKGGPFSAPEALGCSPKLPAPAPAQAGGYHRPISVAALNAALNTLADTGRAPQFVSGATDLWLEVTQRYATFDTVIDLHQVAELNRIERSETALSIGAAVSHRRLVRLFGGHHELGADLHSPAILHLLDRFGSPQVRNRGTIGGNLGNASPIADWPPLLLCLDATLVLGSARGERRLPLTEYYTGYRQTQRAEDEYLARIEIPLPRDFARLQASKISKRTDDDISSVFGAFDSTSTTAS